MESLLFSMVVIMLMVRHLEAILETVGAIVNVHVRYSMGFVHQKDSEHYIRSDFQIPCPSLSTERRLDISLWDR